MTLLYSVILKQPYYSLIHHENLSYLKIQLKINVSAIHVSYENLYYEEQAIVSEVRIF
jgi:hypothetical protein